MPALSETPGDYFRRCRQRAGLSLADVARQVCANRAAALHFAADLMDLEDDVPGDYSYLLALLAKAEGLPGLDHAHLLSLCAATCQQDAA